MLYFCAITSPYLYVTSPQFCWREKLLLPTVRAQLEPCQGSHRLEKYLNLEGFLEKSLKIKSALKSTGKLLKGLEKSLNSSIFCRT